MIDPQKLAYLAGILDGEGHLSIVYHKAQRRHAPIVGVMNTDQRLMAWLSDNFGGRVYHHISPSDKPHWKERFEWRPSQKEIDAILPAVLPFLVIKREQAMAILAFRSTFGTNKRGIDIPECVFQEREAARMTIRLLNTRGSLV